MHNSKLIGIIKQFDKKELKRFDEFLRSPYFNKSAELSLFFAFLRKFAPEFSKSSMTKEKAYAAVHPGKAYNEKKVGYYMSDLLKCAEQFLIVQGTLNEPFASQFQLLQQYNNWNLEKPFHSCLRDIVKLQKEHPHQDSNYYYQQYLVENETNEFLLNNGQNRLKIDQSLQRLINNLDLYYLTMKLRYSCEFINRQTIVSADYDSSMLAEVRQHLDGRDYDDVPSIAIYHQILRTLMDSDNEAHFYKLRDLLDENQHKFSQREARNMYVYALNFCATKINNGQLNFVREAFGVYKRLIDNDLMLIRGQMNVGAFKNINTIACMAEEYEWATQFINDYHGHIQEKDRENALMFNLALLHFYKSEFDQAHAYLNKVVPDTLVFNLDTRLLLLRVYYEMDESEALTALLSSFRIYLKRNRVISDALRDAYLNLIQFVRELMRAEGNKEKLDGIHANILKSNRVGAKKWLLQKVNEAEQGKHSKAKYI